jgi:Siphovirus-type tail component, C-terminal domain
MLTMISVENIRDGVLQLPLMDVSGGYIVRDIQGLDPVKATLTSSQLAQMDGAQPQNARREARNILMKLGLEPDYVSTSVAGLRSGLYDYFMPKSAVTVGFHFDGVLFGKTDAIVESMDNNMFSADPQVDISLICYDPDFYAPDPTVMTGLTVGDLTTRVVPYQGSSDTGVRFTLTFPDAATELRLYNTRPDNVINILTVMGTFLAGDILTIDTSPGHKQVTVTRAGLTFSVLYWMDHSSTWISLTRGDNLFRAYYDGPAISYSLEYTARHGGL